jgi:hypothetical protein
MYVRVGVARRAAGGFRDNPAIALRAGLAVHEHAGRLAEEGGDRAVGGALVMLIERRENPVEMVRCHVDPLKKGGVDIMHNAPSRYATISLQGGAKDERASHLGVPLPITR